MTTSCPNCGEEIDVFHSCDTRDNNFDSTFGTKSKSRKKISLSTVVLLAPLLGIVLDLFSPLPSSMVHSLLVSILGSMIIAIVWVSFTHDGPKSFKFYLRNLKNFAFTPLILRIFTSSDSKRTTFSWLGVVAASTIFQILLFTPGNSSYLERQVSKQIEKESGAELEVNCPTNMFYLYGENIECRVKTGILGITVPARVSISPILGTSEIKISLI